MCSSDLTVFSTTFTPRKSKSCGKGDRNSSTKLDIDKWTVGLNKGGLYNGVKPPEEGDQKILRKNIKEESL